ncbi:ABC transporter ATP-binding protein [Dongia sedimenti]|uniref:ABC transporter ATP-binding protein n=1 Tax=Dongia sedimenti TaxID=3064282 RepID=A0ABU0YV16_9PROT|nr:ABC transporter ATP-binding protein [Rhodospirillaceae bacterium R-7]
MDAVSLKSVSKHYGDKPAVAEVDLDVMVGEFVALLGPSGCGKTTLLRLLAGFETPDAGTISIGVREVARAGALAVPPEQRGVGMVFQSHALWPHMTVGENVEYALKIRKIPGPERRKMVERALDTVGLGERRDSQPDQLSGGQRQRVALARCLAMEPSVVLMDEPLASLDVHLRESLQAEFHRLHRQLGATIVYVTHDQSEAMALADRVAVLDHGRLQQVAPPRGLYAEPATAMVADFVGRGMVVPLDTAVPGRAGSVEAQLWGETIHLRSMRSGASMRACLRPEGLSLGETGIAAKVDRAVFEGAATILHCRVDRAPDVLLRVLHRAAPPAEGSPVKIAIGDGWLLPTAA